METMPTQYRLTVEAMDGAETPRRYNIIPQSHKRGPMGSAAYFSLRQGGGGGGGGGVGWAPGLFKG